MKYASWATNEMLQKLTVSVNRDTNLKASGLPMGYDEKNFFINDKESHSLVIGSSGSGKTQAVVLPMLKMSVLAGESFLVNDVKGELYQQLSDTLKERGYQLVVIDYQDKKFGNNWNPLTLPYQMYQAGNKDEAMSLLENVGYYLFYHYLDYQGNNDPFWTNTTINYFTGLALYLFENAKPEEINLNSLFSLSLEGTEKVGDKTYLRTVLDDLSKTSNIYMNLAGTVLAPPETKGSILSVFNQKMKQYIAREQLSKMLSVTDFNISHLVRQKTAVFIIGGNKPESNSLIPLFVEQFIYCIKHFTKEDEIYQDKKYFNILLDEFESMTPLQDFATQLNGARGLKVRFILLVRSMLDLVNTYGKENAEIIKMCVGNIVYLFANDTYTLTQISDYCGNQWNSDINQAEPLITIEELKTLKPFESIILVPRYMPFRVKLLPDYQIPWPIAFSGSKPELKKETDISIYHTK